MNGYHVGAVADIFQYFPITAPAGKVFAAISLPEGLDQWWTLSSRGTPVHGSDYALDFGPDESSTVSADLRRGSGDGPLERAAAQVPSNTLDGPVWALRRSRKALRIVRTTVLRSRGLVDASGRRPEDLVQPLCSARNIVSSQLLERSSWRTRYVSPSVPRSLKYR